MSKTIRRCIMHALAMRVLIVAVYNMDAETYEVYDWTAYIDSVPGNDHNKEYTKVVETGDKLAKEIAFIIFPGMGPNKWRQ